MLLSVIITFFNNREYVEKCLESVRKQNYEFVEVIVLDDCSSDGTYESILLYAETNPGVIDIIIRNDVRMMSGESRNIGIERANGEYIVFIDGDDWIDEKMYSTMMNIAIKYNSDVVICNYIECFNDNSCVKRFMVNSQTICQNVPAGEIYLESGFFWNMIVKKDLYTKYNIKFFKGIIYEDLIYHIIIAYAKQISTVNECFYYHRKHSCSQTSYSKFEIHKDILTASEWLLSELTDRNLLPLMHEETEYLMLRYCCNYMVYLLLNQSNKIILSELRDIKERICKLNLDLNNKFYIKNTDKIMRLIVRIINRSPVISFIVLVFLRKSHIQVMW